ncbi:MAG: VOC family protein [Alphaproteobacteria bacterium]|nr:VOC family protein [Alphaproteobacteria bacterium]
MKVQNYYPVLCVSDVAAQSEFYQKHFNFQVGFDSDWYVHLVMKDNPDVSIAFVQKDHPSVPQDFRKDAAGVILNFEVEDVDAFYEKACESNLDIKLELRDEAWGQRHFILTDPSGAMIDMIKIIPPSEEFLKQYKDVAD